MGQPFPAGGTGFTFTASSPSLVGLTLYSAAVYLDQGAIVASNGISFTFVATGANAGPDAVALTNEEVTLDGSGLLDPGTGQLPSGTTVQWSIAGSPPGSNPSIRNSQGAFGVFSSDIAGTYAVDLQINGPGGLSGDQVDVMVYDVTFASPVDGAFTSSPVSVSGSVSGPGIASLEINNQSTAINAGSFNAGTLTPTGLMNPITASLTTATGKVLERTITVINGTGAPVGSLASPGTAIRIGGATLDGLEPAIELLLQTLPLNQVITTIPPVPLVPSGLFTATLQFTGASFDPTSVDFDIYPLNNAIGISMTLNQLQITADVTGDIFGAPYSETMTISADSVVLSGEMVIASNANGVLEVTMQNSSVTLTNFNLSVTGALGLFQGLIEPLVQTGLETALAGILSSIPQALNPLLANVVLSVDLTASGIPMTVDFPLNGVFYDMDGFTIANDFQAMSTSLSPNAPQITDYLTTVGSVPGFGTSTPINMVPFDIAAGLNDETLNQSLAEFVRNGVLELDVTGSLGTGTGAIALTAGALNVLLPGTGFDRFDANAPGEVSVRWTTAPATTFSPTGTEMAELHIGNALVTISVDEGGTSVPVLSLGASVQAGLTIVVDPAAGTLTITPGTATVATSLRGSLAGTDPGGAPINAVQIIQQLLPLITGPLSSIPLPGTGLGGAVVEISVSGANPDTLTTYVDLP